MLRLPVIFYADAQKTPPSNTRQAPPPPPPPTTTTTAATTTTTTTTTTSRHTPEYDSRHAIFTAISIPSSQNLLLVVFPLPVVSRDFSLFFFAFLWSKQPKVLVFAIHLNVGMFSENLFFLDFVRACFCALGRIYWYLQGFVAFSTLNDFSQKCVSGLLGNFTVLT